MTHEERVYHHLYETMEGIAEQSERIARLEELVLDMNECIEHSSLNCDGCSLDKCNLYEFNCRMRELGIEVK